MHKRTPRFGARVEDFVVQRQGWLACAFMFAAICLAVAPVRANDLSEPDPAATLTLVELYTSQGCSSCPPADSFLEDLSGRPDVLALSFHVDYWNTEQWKDPFSHKSFSLRQQAYREALDTDYVYTPQIVVAGTYAVPGGRRPSVLEAIQQASSQQSAGPHLSVDRLANDRINVTVSASQDVPKGTVYAAVYNSQKFTRVRGGENRGRTLSNINVVRRLIALAPYVGKEQTFTFELSDLDASSSDGVAVFIQADKVGRILSSAAVIPRAIPAAQVTLRQEELPTLR